MAIQASILHRSNSNDGAGEINALMAGISRGGFVENWHEGIENENFAPTLQPVAGQLKILVDRGASNLGWTALSHNGLVATENVDDYTLDVVDGVKTYIVLRLHYVPTVGGSILEFQALSASAYNSHTHKKQLLIVGTIDLTAGGFTEVSSAEIAYDERSRIVGLYDNRMLPSVDTFTTIATVYTVSTYPLKDGDIVYVRDSTTFYGYDLSGAVWNAIGGAATVQSMQGRTDLALREYRRSMHSSGVLTGGQGGAFGHALAPVVEDFSSVADRFGVGSLRAFLNGHLTIFQSRYIDLAAKPGAGTRYDLVYLEVYTTQIVTPSTLQYAESSGGTLDAATISARLAALTDNATSGSAFCFAVNDVEYMQDSKYAVTVMSLRSVSGIGDAGVTDVYDLAGMGAPTNSDATAWAHSTSTQSDARVWLAAHTSAEEGFSYAIPLFVVLRTSAENAGAGDAIKEFRSGTRHVFPVYPECTIGNTRTRTGAHLIAARKAVAEPSLFSGFYNPLGYESQGSLDVGFSEARNLIVDGYRVLIEAADSLVTLAADDASGGRRDFVHAECRFVHYPDQAQNGRSIHSLGVFSPVAGYAVQYEKEVFLQVDFVSADVGELEDTPESEAVLGYSRHTTDSGLWILADAAVDPRINTQTQTLSIPVALAHRWNTGVFNIGTNPNGGAGSRPDGYVTGAIDTARQIVPMGHTVGMSRFELDQSLDESFSSMCRGGLHTLMQQHPSHSGIAGAKLMYANSASNSSISGTTGMGLAPNGERTLWSEAVELVPMGFSFDPTDASASSGSFTWTETASGEGTVDIVCPAGVAVFVGENDTFVTDGPHLIKGRATKGTPNKPVCFADGDSAASVNPTIDMGSVVVTTSDSFGNPTNLQLKLENLPVAGEICHFYLWGIKQRSTTDAQHTSNGGLEGIVDRPLSASYGALGVGTDLNVEPLIANMTKDIAAATVITFDTTVELAAAVSESGTLSYESFLGVSVTGVPRSTIAGFGVTMNDAQTQMIITFPSTITGTVNVMVGYSTTTVSEWLEFSRAARSVRGFFKWSEDIIVTGQTAASGIYSFAEREHVQRPGSLWKRNTATTNDWEWIPEDEAVIIAFEGSVHYTLTSLDAAHQGAGLDLRFSAVILVPPATGTENIIVYTEGTPYQGISVKNSVSSMSELITDALQGEVMSIGKTFLTTAGYHGYYVQPLDVTEGATFSAFDAYDGKIGDPFLATRARAMQAAGTGFWKARFMKVQYYHYTTGALRTVFDNGLDAVIDRLPYPDFENNTDLIAEENAGGFNVHYRGSQIMDWNFKYREMSLGAGVLGGGFFVNLPEGVSAEQVGAVNPRPGLTVEYGDPWTSTQISDSEDVSFLDGNRGVSVVFWAYDATGAAFNKVLSPTVSFLAFGGIEGLLHSEAGEGSVGFVAPSIPNYMAAGSFFKIRDVERYYGGHVTLIRATDGDNENHVMMQVSGGPQGTESAVFPNEDKNANAEYPIRIGNTFDAYYPVGRPISAKRKT